MNEKAKEDKWFDEILLITLSFNKVSSMFSRTVHVRVALPRRGVFGSGGFSGFLGLRSSSQHWGQPFTFCLLVDGLFRFEQRLWCVLWSCCCHQPVCIGFGSNQRVTLSCFSYGRCGHSLVSVRQFGSRVCCFSCRFTSGGLAFVRSAFSIWDFGSKGVYGHKGSGLETAIFRSAVWTTASSREGSLSCRRRCVCLVW